MADTATRLAGSKKHGNTLVGSLRKTYGEHFAAGHRKDMIENIVVEDLFTSICGNTTNRMRLTYEPSRVKMLAAGSFRITLF